uniref:EGF-like domain-containing protein n=1 Tax=Seriola lalandi dorsalis TaxID=1841481 RepID=A0A3B4YBF6_SERLL
MLLLLYVATDPLTPFFPLLLLSLLLGNTKCCKNEGGELSSVDLGQPQETLRSLLGELSGSFWVEPMKGTGVKTGEAASGPRNCSSVLTGGALMMSFSLCDEKLDGFLCRFSFEEPCGSLLAGGDVQVRYNLSHWGLKVEDTKTFPQGATAVAEKVGAEDPDSMHVCFGGKWFHAPWNCEVMGGGCEHKCNSSTNTCMCPESQTLHHNNFTCIKDPCADCKHGCEQKGDSFFCKCEKGFRLAKDRKSCLDVDECKEQDPCKGVGMGCENKQGGFECKCKDGFVEEDKVCVDVSICDKCEHMKCNKHDGIYRCECHEGFRVSPKNNNTTFCTDINECEHYHMCDHTCENLFGSYRCSCDEGYELVEGHTCEREDHTVCIEIDECISNYCDQQCTNTFGSYVCSCSPGYTLVNQYNCVKNEDHTDGSQDSTTAPDFPTTSYIPGPTRQPSGVSVGAFVGIILCTVFLIVLVVFLAHHILSRRGKMESSGALKAQEGEAHGLHRVATDA